MATTSAKSRRNRKIAAISAGLLVIGVGATYTLASWTDSEWVWGGANGDPGVGTKTFNVKQDASSPFAAPGVFDDFDSNPGDELTFSTGALALTPGDTVYAPVALRTEAGSVAGDVVLQGAVAANQPGTTDEVTVNDDDGDLWKNIQVSVYTANNATPPTPCAPNFDATGWTQIVSNATLGTAAAAEQTLAANAGSTQHYCFTLTLSPTPQAGSVVTDINDLQGRTIAPAWKFAAKSN